MVDDQSVARGLETYHRLFGETDIDRKPDTEERKGLRLFTIAHLFANIWSREEQLPMRDRSMITVALLAQQGRDPELIQHLQGALNQNISPDQLSEIMIQVAHYGGWPAGHNGQQITEEVLKIRKELVTLNEDIGKAEKEGNITFLTRILDDVLVFHRASGEVIGKEQYLQDLQSGARTYETLDSDQVKVWFKDDISVVTLRVTTKGKRNGEDFSGQFRNVRKFVKADNQWRCVAWRNSRLGQQ